MSSSNRVLLSQAKGIDIHHHFLPPFFVDALTQSNHPAAPKAKALAWSPSKSLDMMDETGIQTAILSLSLPGVSFRGVTDSAMLARQSNEFAARMIAEYPRRFGAFASLPMLNAQAALAEIEYALDTLNLDGVMLLSNVFGKYLGDQQFDPILAELNRRRAIVFLHANYPPRPGLNDFVEFPHDISRALASLTESGFIERYHRIRYILAYGGGTIPFIAARVTIVGMDVFGSFLKTMISYIKRARAMRQMNYDLTATTDPYSLQALCSHTKTTHILMGSNYPWTPTAAFVRHRDQFRTFKELELPELETIESRNALNLIPSIRTHLETSVTSPSPDINI